MGIRSDRVCVKRSTLMLCEGSTLARKFDPWAAPAPDGGGAAVAADADGSDDSSSSDDDDDDEDDDGGGPNTID